MWWRFGASLVSLAFIAHMYCVWDTLLQLKRKKHLNVIITNNTDVSMINSWDKILFQTNGFPMKKYISTYANHTKKAAYLNIGLQNIWWIHFWKSFRALFSEAKSRKTNCKNIEILQLCNFVLTYYEYLKTLVCQIKVCVV